MPTRGELIGPWSRYRIPAIGLGASAAVSALIGGLSLLKAPSPAVAALALVLGGLVVITLVVSVFALSWLVATAPSQHVRWTTRAARVGGIILLNAPLITPLVWLLAKLGPIPLESHGAFDEGLLLAWVIAGPPCAIVIAWCLFSAVRAAVPLAEKERDAS